MLAAFGLVEIGGRPDHGHAIVGQRLDHAPEILATDRIDADARLVEQQHARRRHQRAGEP